MAAKVEPVLSTKNGRKLLYLLGGVAGSALGSCDPVNGAAVEVSWVVHTPGGYSIDDCACAEPAIASVRLLLTPQAGGESARSYTFACKKQRGVTPFEVPAGLYQMEVQALDSTGQPVPSAVAPPPFVRNLVWGQPASMDAQLITAACDPDCANKNGSCKAQ